MKEEHLTQHPPLAHQRLIQLLNQDLACEYQAIIACIVYSEVLRRASFTAVAEELERHAADEFRHAKGLAEQVVYLGGVPCTPASAVTPAAEPRALADPESDNESASVGQVRYPINRAGVPEELDFRAALRAIIVPEHAVTAALGVEVLPIKPLPGTTASRPRAKAGRPRAAAKAMRKSRGGRPDPLKRAPNR